jgi:gliding motility-associated-like protein
VIFVVGALAIVPSPSQACSCPPVCSTCAGGIVEVTLQYLAEQSGQVLILDGSVEIFNRVVRSGEIFTVTGSLTTGKFVDTSLKIFVDGVLNTEIGLLCSPDVKVNARFGDFVLVAAQSLLGGRVCCATPQTKDRVAPVFLTLPDDIQVNAGSTCVASVTWSEPEVYDCNLDYVVSNYASGETFPIGEHLVVYTAVDKEKNTTTVIFKVIVLDQSPPVITGCPADIHVLSLTGGPEAVTWSEPQASDNCTLETFSASHLPESTFAMGVTTVTYLATDEAGNTASCSFNVTVEFVLPEPVIEMLLTPDGDGINDLWKIGNIRYYPENRVTVFDRWGNVVYDAKGYDNESVVWDGTGNGRGRVSTGTYFYSVVYVNGGRKSEKRGFIEVIN